MSRLIMIVRPALVPGYQLAGVETYTAESGADTQAVITPFITADEQLLLAIDERLFAEVEPSFQRQLDQSRLFYLPIPSGEPLPPETSSRARLAELIRHAIGFHITFQGTASE